MELYYQNETLYIDVSESINDELYSNLKRRLFSIIDDYGIDRVVLQASKANFDERKKLMTLEREYNLKYNGHFVIK